MYYKRATMLQLFYTQACALKEVAFARLKGGKLSLNSEAKRHSG